MELNARKDVIDNSPRVVQQMALGHRLNTSHSASGVVQRVLFPDYNAQRTPDQLPPALKQLLANEYTGNPENKKDVPIRLLTTEARDWWASNISEGVSVGDTVTVEIEAKDWETLGVKPALPNIEIASMSKSFFDQQTALMTELNNIPQVAAFIAKNPGKPLRIASLEFVRNGGGLLITNWALKKIEPQVASSVQEAFLPPELAGIRQQVQANVNQTLFSAGQFQWLAANWEEISRTHDVYVDVDYYPNRLPDRSGVLHKDSVGETLFVNLTYNNADQGVSPEYVADDQGHAAYEDRMPQPAKNLIERSRAANRDDGSIKGDILPKYGRASFIDPAIWHATPFYDHRIPEVQMGDEQHVTYEQLVNGLESSNLSETQKTVARAFINNVKINGREVNTLLQNSTISELRFDDNAQGTYEQIVNELKGSSLSEMQKAAVLALIKTLKFEGRQVKALLQNSTLSELRIDDNAQGTYEQIVNELKGSSLSEMQKASTLDLLKALKIEGRQVNSLLQNSVISNRVDHNQQYTYEQLVNDLERSDLSETQKAVARALFKHVNIKGSQVKELFQQNEPLRVGHSTHADPKQLAPGGRRQRAMSIYLNRNLDELKNLQQQREQPRSFIRTWVILRQKKQTGVG